MATQFSLSQAAKQQQHSELAAAFQVFNEMSGQLEQSYRELEGRVDQLTGELATVRSEKLKQLAEKEKLADRLEALHQALPVAVIWTDQRNKIRSANQAANAIFKTDIENKNWQQILEQHFSFDGHELLNDAGDVYSYQQQSLDLEQGQVIILTDVTLSHQLQQTNYRQKRLAELGEITAGIAHQVRTPLASALLSLDHFSHPKTSESLQKKSIDRIRQNLLHLDKLVNDMLLFAKGGEFDNNCISIALLLHNLDVYIQQKHYPHFKFVIDNPLNTEHDYIVAGSGDALLSVLISLVENACQLASAAQPITVTIKLQSENNSVIIRVIDDGPGLDEAECEQVFKPFYTTKKQGTGLGLAISRSIIQAHHGELEIHSEKGHGAEMRINLNRYTADGYLQSNQESEKFTSEANSSQRNDV